MEVYNSRNLSFALTYLSMLLLENTPDQVSDTCFYEPVLNNYGLFFCFSFQNVADFKLMQSLFIIVLLLFTKLLTRFLVNMLCC